MEGRKELAPGAVIQGWACGRAWSPCCWGRTSRVGGKRDALGSPWSQVSRRHALHWAYHAAWRVQPAGFPRGPFPHPFLARRFASARARSPAPPSLPLRCEKAGAERRRRRKAHAQPLGSRLSAAGRASAVCACALRHCGFNSFRVCLQWDPSFELRVKHRISTILSQLWPGCDLSCDVFVFSESHKKYGEHLLNSMP